MSAPRSPQGIARPTAPPTDRALLQRFAAGRDEAAFAELVRRHGPLVYGICRRVLGQRGDAEDAFQAAFVVLARKARELGDGETVAPWLARVTYRLAARARVSAARRRQRERQAVQMKQSPQAPDPTAAATWRDLRPILDAELDRLPEKYRAPVVLCYLENRTNDEAAALLGWTRGTVAGRLARARDLLRLRLERRGVVLTGGLLATLMVRSTTEAAVPPALAAAAVQSAAAGTAALPPGVAALAGGGATAAPAKASAVVLAAVLAVGGAAMAVNQTLPDPPAAPVPATAPSAPKLSLPPAAALPGHAAEVVSCAFSPDGRLLATGGADNVVVLTDPRTRREVARLRGNPDQGTVTGLAFAPDGRTVAGSNWDFHLYTWDVATGQLKKRRQAHEGGVDAVVYSGDGKVLVTAGGEHHRPAPGELKLWDAATLEPRGELAGHDTWIRCLAVAPDGKTVASASQDGIVKLWDLPGRRLRHTLKGHIDAVLAVAFSLDGTKLASASNDNTARLWDVSTGAVVQTLRGHESEVWGVAFSPDGRTLATGGTDLTVRLWDLVTGRPRLTLPGHTRWVGPVAFTPDGTGLVSADWAGAVRLWDLTPAKR